MNRVFVFILFLLISTGCSLNEDSKLWNKEDEKISKIKNKKKVFKEEKKQTKELNSSLKLDLSRVIHNNEINYNLNNFGSLKYKGNLKEIGKYKFSKFDDFVMVPTP